ncbi:MAG: hypothetical protein WCD18_18500, partial [Thermosynechococcaceae cyanobacterium]
DDHYLSDADLNNFQQNIKDLANRVAAYESLRDRELAIVQPAADYLAEEFPSTDSRQLERVIKHWLTIFRYAAMAMVLQDSEFLNSRVLEWLPDLAQAYQIRDIELKFYRLLQVQLKSSLSEEHLVLIQPYLEEGYKILLNGKPSLVASA